MLTMDHNKYMLVSFLICIMVLLVSHNCNGLKNVHNFKKYVSIIDEKNIDFMLFQETFWDNEFVASIEHLYEGKMYYNNGANSRKGVAILASKKLCGNVNFIYKDNDGRFLHVQFIFNDKIYNIINVYAGNIVNERAVFFDFLNNYLKNYENIVIAGDWNTTLSNIDRCSRTVHKHDIAVRNLEKVMSEHNIFDIWRYRNPERIVFSRKRVCEGELKQSRIDYFLLHRNLTCMVQSVNYYDTSFSDHGFVELRMNFNEIEKGPGVWILNNIHLQNEEYIEKVNRIIEDEKKCPLYTSEFLIWWDNLKYKLKKFSQVFSKRVYKEKNSEFYKLQNKLQKMSESIAKGHKVDLIDYENLKLELSRYEDEKCRGAILRSKAFWATESDSCSKYFLQLEKHKQELNCIRELMNEDNEIVSNTDDLLDVQYTFYSKLYSCVEIEENVMQEFVQNVPLTICDDDKVLCDNEISVDEIAIALKSMSKNKSPGSDGLTVEFYCTFFDSLTDILVKLYTEVENNSMLSRSMRSGVISLIYKKKGDKKLLKNYRPISLLQVDYKILARVMANRFKQVLCRIVSSSQTCCISGRDISDTIASIRDIIELTDEEELDCYILKMDQEKAFDRVSHTYLIHVLKRYGFGERFIRWMEIFYRDIQSSVKCNGFLTKYFKIKNGIRQGCPISALLYVLSAEPLQYAIRNNANIKGIEIPNSNNSSLIFQHADDTTLTLCGKRSIKESLSIFDTYGRASGSKINMLKSEIMCVGKGYLNVSEQEQLGLKYCEDCIQVLGVYVGTNSQQCELLNWKDKVFKIKAITNMWRQRRLTLSGRVTVINSLLVSRLWYTIAVCTMPDWALDDIRKHCVDFLWNGGSHLVNYRTIVGDKTEGGLKYPDIYLKMLSFRLKFLTRFLNDDFKAVWKDTMKHFLRKIGNMKLDIECLCMDLCKKDLKVLPIVYQEIMQAWLYLKASVDIEMTSVNVFNQPIFLNADLKLQGKTLLWSNFIDAGIVQLKHITYEVIPGFLPFNAVKEIIEDVVDVDVEKLKQQYELLIANIPDNWKSIVSNDGNLEINVNTPEIFIVFKNKSREFISCTTKDFYKFLVQKCFIEPDAKRYWLDKFDVSDMIFESILEYVHSYWKSPDCVELDFKIFHNRVFTNEKLKRIGLQDYDHCLLCIREKEDLFHLFLRCEKLKDFHGYIKKLLCELFVKSKIDILQNMGYDRIFMLGVNGKEKDVNCYFVNFFLSVARLCIMKRRSICKQSGSNIDVFRLFKYVLKHYVTYFHTYCKYAKKDKNFNKHFLENNSIVILQNDTINFYL